MTSTASAQTILHRSDKSRPGRYFEDFHLGQRLRHGSPRSLGAADAACYLALTGSRQALACNTALARRLGHPQAPLDDLLVFNIAFGKTVNDISLNAIANLGYADLRFLRRAYPGDTLRCESEVIGLRPSRKPGGGIVGVRSTCLDQHDTPVMQWMRWVMVRRRGDDAMEAAGLTEAPPPPAPEETSVPPEAVPPLSRAALAEAWLPATGGPDLWDDYAPGERLDHPGGMTLEDADHMSATRYYQNNAQVHFDALHSAGAGGRLVYGGHVMSLCMALAHDGFENHLGLHAIHAGRHTRPIRAGDTVYACSAITGKLPVAGRDDVGALRLRLFGLKNQPPASLPPRLPLDDLAAHPAIVLDLDCSLILPRR